MMEGTYFFGEHLRWNLGWSNPNQAGAFVAMLIPWIWGLSRWMGKDSRKAFAVAMLWLVIELGLWFLLCKTYSRGALVAVLVSGGVFLAWSWLLQVAGARGPKDGLERDASVTFFPAAVLIRLVGIGGLLMLTGFFARIDPAYVSQDASAGNRLTLWKGGLQMIAASPWEGWGKGVSGPGFMQWFQSLNAKEAYAGMVNSYLHVGVERGILVLGGVLTVVVGMWIFSLWAAWRLRKERMAAALCLGASGSWVVFAVANFFSTLWIFANLWWVPVIAVLVMLGVGVWWLRGRVYVLLGTCFSGALLVAAGVVFCLWWAGNGLPSDVTVRRMPGGNRVVVSASPSAKETVLFFPDRTVLGEAWGKEVRRLALKDPTLRIEAPVDERPMGDLESGEAPRTIMACGGQAAEGLAALKRFPQAEVVIVHPLGKPILSEDLTGKVTVLLPALDTSGVSRAWKSLGQKRGWKSVTSPGVGQDIRLVWPNAVMGHGLMGHE